MPHLPSDTAGDTPAPNHLLRGVGWILLASLLFVSLDATAKFLVARYAMPQVAWGRFTFHLLFVAVFILLKEGKIHLPKRPAFQLMRSFFLASTTALFFMALFFLPLAEVSALMFLSPIVVTVLSVPLLGEKVGLRRWLSVLVGFIGAVIIIRPGSGFMQWAALFPLGAALVNAIYQINTRQLRSSDHPMTSLFLAAICGAVGFSLALPFFWQAPSLFDLGLMMLTGFFGATSHYCLFRAFQAAEASVLVPFSYAALIWATIYGYILFGEVPDHWTIVGAVIIAASGLYIFHREQIRKASG